MIIEGEFQINAPVQQTWDFLANIREVACCIPSCQRVEVFDDKNFSLTISQKLGPISVTFDTKTSFIKVNPPHRVVAFGQGKDLKMGSSFELTNQMDLVPISGKETLVRYKADVKINGRLASMGQSLIKILATREVGNVVGLIQERLGGKGHEAV